MVTVTSGTTRSCAATAYRFWLSTTPRSTGWHIHYRTHSPLVVPPARVLSNSERVLPTVCRRRTGGRIDDQRSLRLDHLRCARYAHHPLLRELLRRRRTQHGVRERHRRELQGAGRWRGHAIHATARRLAPACTRSHGSERPGARRQRR